MRLPLQELGQGQCVLLALPCSSHCLEPEEVMLESAANLETARTAPNHVQNTPLLASIEYLDINWIRKLIFPQQSGFLGHLQTLRHSCPSKATADPEGRGGLASRGICVSSGTAPAGSQGALTELRKMLLVVRKEEQPAVCQEPADRAGGDRRGMGLTSCW